MEEPEVEEPKPQPTGPMILANRKVRRFIKKMSKGEMNLTGRTEGPLLLILQLTGLMNRNLKAWKKRIEFNKLLNVTEDEDEEV